MSEHDNWRAKCTGPGCVAVRPFGDGTGHFYTLDRDGATELRDQLTAAIEEAKKLDDPFEHWWASLPPHPQWPDHRYVVQRRVSLCKHDAKPIYDSILKAAP